MNENNMVSYQEILPTLRLRRFVRCYWTLRGGETPNRIPEPVLPDGCSEIVFHFGDRFRQLAPVGGLQPAELLVGPSVHAAILVPTGRIDVLGIRIRPSGLRLFTSRPAVEFKNRILGLQDTDLVLGDVCLEKLAAEAPAARVELLERALLKRIGSTPEESPGSLGSRIIVRSRCASVGRVAEAMNMSTRHLQRVFRLEVGLTPKELARVVRFQRAVGLQPKAGSLGRVALAAGYSDQAHFNREFRNVAGVTPTAFFSSKYPVASAFLPVSVVEHDQTEHRCSWTPQKRNVDP